MREQSEQGIHQTKRQYEKYVVGEMLSKIGMKNREPKSKVQNSNSAEDRNDRR